jgi:hypothetical protein
MGEVINMDKFKRQRSLSLSMLLLLAEQLGRDIEDTRRNIAHDYRMGWLTQEEREWLLVAVESLPPLPVSDDEQGPEPKKKSRKPARRPWRSVPKDWQPGDDHRKMASELRVDFELELAKFRDHEFATTKKDPDATFRNWLRNAADRGTRRPAPGLMAHSAIRSEEEAEERRRIRNNLIEAALAGRFGTKAQAWAKSGEKLADLADKLEKVRRGR